MTTDKTNTPESGVGSGGPSAPVAGSASRPAPAADGTPEPDLNAVAPADAPADEARESEAETGVAREPEAVSEDDVALDAAAEVSGPAADDLDVAALAEKAQKADEYLDLAQRTRAEFENYRKRAVREAAAAQERGAVKLALELLPAIDNLDRALAHAATTDEAENGDASLASGIRHVQTDVLAALKRAGIEPFSPEGEAFDPQYHEAVAQQPIEGAAPGTVIEVYQRGYRLGESVLRPARVVVAG